MTKTVSATEAKARLGALMQQTAEEDEPIVIVTRGKPKAVLLSYEKYSEMQAVAEEARRQQLLERLDALGQRLQAGEHRLSPEEAEQLAERFGREFVEELIASGKVQYKGQ